ncbi:RNA polymerase sigma factor [Maribacter thermophilus]|uniref:RNA polymerase sigma factor n=1 Tax=Maribacter thermophilus TaxID=1197874 RepID=UPI000A6E7AE6|nr:RNA polymerase sigma-70 factor [Maribacter thermophilus]
MMDFKDNKVLIKCLQQNNKKAFSFLVDSYHHRLCVYANSLVNNSMLADDIVQNVFINVWEKRNMLNPGHSLKSFLYKSVYNEFIDQYRKSQSLLRIEKKYIEHLNTIVAGEDEESTKKLISDVKNMMEDLPPKCKQVFMLSKKEGLTNIEISEHLEISVKAVEAQITRGFKILRKKLSDKVKPVLFILFNRRYIEKKY